MEGCLRCVITLAEFTAEVEDDVVVEDLEPRNDGSVPSFADLIGGDHHIAGIIVA